MLLEFDLAGAEWVIVAYLSGDENMIKVVESGESPHVNTAALMTGLPKDIIEAEQKFLQSATDPDTIRELRREHVPEIFDLFARFLPRNMTVRQMGKKSNHGMNYNVKYRTFALVNEISEPDAIRMIELYNTVAYPSLPQWRKDLQKEFRENKRFIWNLLGKGVRLLDKPGPDLWNAITAYNPQSTVADIIRRALIAIYRDYSELAKPMFLLAPVHDSILLDYPEKPLDRLREFIKLMKGYMTVELEAKGRKFTLGVDVKGGPNWGNMKGIPPWK